MKLYHSFKIVNNLQRIIYIESSYFLQKFIKETMWLYIVGGILLVMVIIVLYLVYRGYNKIKPKPIVGIPCPPLTHQMLGHPDKMMHPLKHELRLEVTEYARSPVHQVMLFIHSTYNIIYM